MTAQVKMLTRCVQIMEDGGKFGAAEAFERLVEWLAVQAKVPSGIEDIGITTPSVALAVAEQLDRALDVVLLKRVVGDHLRDTAVALGLMDPPGPGGAKITNLAEPTHAAVFDPRCGTGTHLVDMFKEFGRAYLYYGATESLPEYLMTLVTMHLNEIPAVIVKGDPTIHNLEITSANWQYANFWYPAADRNMERLVSMR